MVNIQPSIDAIERLLIEGTPQSLAYAALECRLAIEALCYERLSIAHNYISHDDLKRWQPRDVVNILIQEVDAQIASTFTLYISRDSVPEGKGEMVQSDYEALEYLPVGTQIGFDPKLIGKLWNALANVALHVQPPKSADDVVAIRGEPEKIRARVVEALAEIKRISSRNLLSSGLGEEVSFDCSCGTTNKRRAGLLQAGQTVSCINPACKESFSVEIRDADILFTRRTFAVLCSMCSQPADIPMKWAEKLKVDESLNYVCDCGHGNLLQWKLMQLRESVSKAEG